MAVFEQQNLEIGIVEAVGTALLTGSANGVNALIPTRFTT